MTRTEPALGELYLEDETAWRDAMVELIELGNYDALDYANLKEYLSDMAIRDRREVKSRLTLLIMHILKWIYQPERRTKSWRHSIQFQRRSLTEILGRGVLRNHAEENLLDCYSSAIFHAAAETGLPEIDFPAQCGFTLDEFLQFDPELLDLQD